MNRALVLLVLAACAGRQAQRIPADPPAPVAAAPTPVGPAPIPAAPPAAAERPTLEDKTVVEMSHAWMDAFDRMDSAAFAEPMGPTFVNWEDARALNRELLTKMLDGRKSRGWPARTRTWSDEHVYSAPGTAVFIGRAVELMAAVGDAPASTTDGYNNIVWVHDGTRWVIANYTWIRAGVDAERGRWNDYFKQSVGFNKKPNQLLVDTLKGKKPGAALDVGMGQGRNAIYIASQGWNTTGIDISDEGIRQAKVEASKQKVKLDALLVDVDNYDFGKNKWDLVTLIYAAEDPPIVEKIKPALKKGGLFVCEYFHADSEIGKTGAGGWKTGELAALFKDGFEILRDDVVEDNADWAGQRKTKLVRFVARKK